MRLQIFLTRLCIKTGSFSVEASQLMTIVESDQQYVFEMFRLKDEVVVLTSLANNNAPQSSSLGIVSPLTGATFVFAVISCTELLLFKYTQAAYAAFLASQKPNSSNDDEFAVVIHLGKENVFSHGNSEQ